MKLTKEQLPPRYTKKIEVVLPLADEVPNINYRCLYNSNRKLDERDGPNFIFGDYLDQLFEDAADEDYPELQKAANARLVQVLSCVIAALGRTKATEEKHRSYTDQKPLPRM